MLIPEAPPQPLDTISSPVTLYQNMPGYFPKMCLTKIPRAFMVSPILMIYMLLIFSVQIV